MTLNSFAAAQRKRLFEELERGEAPSIGAYSDLTLRDGRAKGKPQMGATRYEPSSVVFEFIFPDPKGAATILTVTVPAPERIVFLPVPPWVIEQIWQGEISGSYHFLSDAEQMLAEIASGLAPEGNSEVVSTGREDLGVDSRNA